MLVILVVTVNLHRKTGSFARLSERLAFQNYNSITVLGLPLIIYCHVEATLVKLIRFASLLSLNTISQSSFLLFAMLVWNPQKRWRFSEALQCI
jgi:hypothetical protein